VATAMQAAGPFGWAPGKVPEPFWRSGVLRVTGGSHPPIRVSRVRFSARMEAGWMEMLLAWRAGPLWIKDFLPSIQKVELQWRPMSRMFLAKW